MTSSEKYKEMEIEAIGKRIIDIGEFCEKMAETMALMAKNDKEAAHTQTAILGKLHEIQMTVDDIARYMPRNLK